MPITPDVIDTVDRELTLARRNVTQLEKAAAALHETKAPAMAKGPAPTPTSRGKASPDAWQLDARGKQYVAAGGGRRGPVYRLGNETVGEARERAIAAREEKKAKSAAGNGAEELAAA